MKRWERIRWITIACCFVGAVICAGGFEGTEPPPSFWGSIALLIAGAMLVP